MSACWASEEALVNCWHVEVALRAELLHALIRGPMTTTAVAARGETSRAACTEEQTKEGVTNPFLGRDDYVGG